VGQVYAPLHRGEWLERLPEASIRRRAERLYQQLESDGVLRLLALFLMPPSKSVILGAVGDRFAPSTDVSPSWSNNTSAS